MVRLETERLILRELPPSWATRVARWHDENWGFHRQWEPLRDSAYFTSRMQRQIMRSERNSDEIFHLWLFRRGSQDPESGRHSESGRDILGSVTLSNIVHGFFQSGHLGYKVAHDWARQGLMTEALEAVVAYAFTDLGLHRIEANIMPRNTASLGLARKLGFREEGIARRYLRIQGTWEDHVHMVLLADEWSERLT